MSVACRWFAGLGASPSEAEEVWSLLLSLGELNFNSD
jgi:hypothetical protein